MSTNDDLDFEPVDPELAALLADPTLWEEPSAELGYRVVRAVGEARDAQTNITTPTVDHDSDRTSGASVTSIDSRRRFRMSPSWLAAAASVVLVLGIGVGVLLRTGNDSNERTTQLALAGTELAPTAVGFAAITPTESGLRIELNATGLPRRDGKEFYQAWLKGESGLVPIGTFHTGEDVTLWAGVSLEDFPTLTVTQEEVGDQESSGKRVLIGSATP